MGSTRKYKFVKSSIYKTTLIPLIDKKSYLEGKILQANHQSNIPSLCLKNICSLGKEGISVSQHFIIHCLRMRLDKQFLHFRSHSLLSLLENSWQCWHSSFTCSKLLSTHSRLDLFKQTKEIFVNLNESISILMCLLRSSRFNLSKCFTKVVSINCVDNSEQKVSLNVMFTILRQVR